MKRVDAATKASQSGVSLIELMVSLAIGLILMTAVISVVLNANRTQQELSKFGRQLENGRYAISVLQRELAHAGYYGDYYLLADPPSTLPDPCSTDPATIADALPMYIQGYDAPSGDPPPSCISDADHTDGTDILVVRRVSTTTTAPSSLVSSELYLQGRATDFVLDDGSDSSVFSLTDMSGATADIHKFRVDIYFVGPDNNGVPVLKKLELTDDGGTLGWVERSLVSGIENLQIDYGIDRDGDGTPNAGASGGAFEVAPDAGEWSDVVTTRIHALARNIESTPGYTDPKVYDMGKSGTFDPSDDSYRRHLYTATSLVINATIRRE